MPPGNSCAFGAIHFSMRPPLRPDEWHPVTPTMRRGGRLCPPDARAQHRKKGGAEPRPYGDKRNRFPPPKRLWYAPPSKGGTRRCRPTNNLAPSPLRRAGPMCPATPAPPTTEPGYKAYGGKYHRRGRRPGGPLSTAPPLRAIWQFLPVTPRNTRRSPCRPACNTPCPPPRPAASGGTRRGSTASPCRRGTGRRKD